MIETALKYAAHGWAVFPLSPGAKVPKANTNGHNDATTNPDQVRAWWAEDPGANIGIACGQVSGNLIAVDVDINKEGFKSLQKLGGNLPATYTVTTATGGRHYYYWTPQEIRNSQSRLAKGIDIRGEGGYVVAAGSITGDGTYTTKHDREVAQAPEWLIQAATKQEIVKPERVITDGPADNPGDDYNRRGNLSDLLIKHGWRPIGHKSDNQHWTRPGKDVMTTSATMRDDGTFYVFSTNAYPLEPDRGYSPFAVYAILEHGGDFNAASNDLRQQGYGRQPVPQEQIQAEMAAIIETMSRKPPKIAGEVADYWEPFPLHLLPTQLAEYSKAVADANSVDVAMTALTGLVTLAAAIGNSHEIESRAEYRQPSVLWGCLIAESGSNKSNPMSVMQRALKKINKKALIEYRQKVASWKAGGAKGVMPPLPARTVVDDVTYEAVAAVLERSPRGILRTSDELATFFDGHNQYKKNGNDAARWLSMYEAKEIDIERKGSPMIYVERGAASVIGSIQPGILNKTMGPKEFESGNAARFLMVMPPEVPEMSFPDTAPDHDIMNDIVEKLHAFPHHMIPPPIPGGGVNLRAYFGEDEEYSRPNVVHFTPEGSDLFREYERATHSMREHLDTSEKSVFAKSRGLAMRLALVLHLTKWVTGESPVRHECPVQTVKDAIELACWFRQESCRVYHMVRKPKQSGSEKLLERIARLDEPTVSNLSRNMHKKASEVKAMLRQLEYRGDIGLEKEGKKTFIRIKK